MKRLINRLLRKPVRHPFEPWDNWEDELLARTEQIAHDAGIDTTQDEWWNK
jgi:hypothetical protein